MAMQLILTFIADDRPGLVDTLSQALTECDGNWLESKTANMAGKFAGIVHVEVPDAARAAALRGKLAGLAATGLAVTATDARMAEEAKGAALTISLVGPDHPGIVRDIAHCLAVHRASIEAMETHTADAPMGGGVLFYARIAARAPAGMNDDALRRELEQLASALMVDLDLGALPGPAAGGG